jgi:hypothetical protein
VPATVTKFANAAVICEAIAAAVAIAMGAAITTAIPIVWMSIAKWLLLPLHLRTLLPSVLLSQKLLPSLRVPLLPLTLLSLCHCC